MEELDLNESIKILNLPHKTHGMMRLCGINTLTDAIKLVYNSQNDYFGESLAVRDIRVSLEDIGIDWKAEYLKGCCKYESEDLQSNE